MDRPHLIHFRTQGSAIVNALFGVKRHTVHAMGGL